MSILTADTRTRMARATATMLAMPALMDAIDGEINTIFRENPMLPATEQARRILWGLTLPEFSKYGAENPDAQKTAA